MISRSATNGARRAALTLAAVILALASTPSVASAQNALVINNDIGGRVKPRLIKINALRASGQPVRIEGRVCYSTCTMYLGLPQTCVAPNTEFGFHGPSSYGFALNQQVFDQASRVIAAQYPEVLQDWYMTTARHELHRMYKLKGAYLASIGAATLCDDAT